MSSSGTYRLALPATDDPRRAGTSALGVGRAVEVLSGGRLHAAPYRCDAWTVALVVSVLERLAALGRNGPIAIANIDTTELAGSRQALSTVLDSLTSAAPRWRDTSPPDWSVGHFCALVGLARGPARTVVVVRDSYRALGWNGWHVQEPDAIAAALHRRGAGTGGMIVIGDEQATTDARRALGPVGLVEEWWDNGSPAPTGLQPAFVSARQDRDG